MYLCSLYLIFFIDILVAYDGEKGQVASTMRIYRRSFYLNGKTYSTGGIGEVSTKAEYRSQGHAGKLIKVCKIRCVDPTLYAYASAEARVSNFRNE